MESVVVFSGKTLETMREERGSGHWPARSERVERCEYMVCVRNRRERWSAADFEHGTAFLLAKIDRVVPSTYPNRLVICFDQYVNLHVPDAWRLLTGGQRFPVAYDKTTEILRKLRIDPGKLNWLSLQAPPQARQTEASYEVKKDSFAAAIGGAKASLAESLGISADKIEIVIRT